MTNESAYRIDIEGDEMVIRIRRGSLSEDRISRFLDYIVLESIRQGSQLTEEDAAALANTIDRAAWERVKHKYVFE